MQYKVKKKKKERERESWTLEQIATARVIGHRRVTRSSVSKRVRRSKSFSRSAPVCPLARLWQVAKEKREERRNGRAPSFTQQSPEGWS